MRLQFDAMEIDDTPLSDVEGLLDTTTGTLGVFFHKKAKLVLDYYMDAESVVLGVQGEMDVPVFIPGAKIESVLVDDNSDRLRVTFRFEPNSNTFKRPN